MNCLRSLNPFQHNVIRGSFRPLPNASHDATRGEADPAGPRRRANAVDPPV